MEQSKPENSEIVMHGSSKLAQSVCNFFPEGKEGIKYCKA